MTNAVLPCFGVRKIELQILKLSKLDQSKMAFLLRSARFHFEVRVSVSRRAQF